MLSMAVRQTEAWRYGRIASPRCGAIGGGCHLNRAVGDLLETSGFKIERTEQGYMRGPKAIAFMYEGSAKAR